jgi:hypothetical protein
MALEKIRPEDLTEGTINDLTVNSVVVVDNGDEVLKVKLSTLIAFIDAN